MEAIRPYRESVENSNRQPETPPHRIDNRHQRISCFKPFDTRNELRKTYSRKSVINNENSSNGVVVVHEPPNIATNGKNIVGLSLEPHHIAMWLAVIHVEPANPARPRAAGGAMGFRKIWTLGTFSKTSFRLSSWPAWLSTDMLGLFCVLY
jgi:hypothetical protein